MQRFNNINWKRGKRLISVFLIFVFLILSLNLLPKDNVRIKSISQISESARFSLSTEQIVKGENKWIIPLNQEIKISVNLDSGDFAVDSAEAIIHYDPSIINVKSVNCDANQPLKNALLRSIKKDGNGNQLGIVDIACTAIPLPPYDDPDQLPAFDPVLKNSSISFANLTIEVINLVSNGSLNIEFIKDDPNSSVIMAHEETTNVLGGVDNFIFDSVSAENSAGLSLQPANNTYAVGEQFQVNIGLNCGQYNIDSVDAIINYDKDALKVIKVDSGTIFPSYPLNTFDELLGKIELSGQIIPGDILQPVTGNNLLFGTITFEALIPQDQALVFFDFKGIGQRNDSNIVELGKANDVLTLVSDAEYSLELSITPTPQPTETPIPTVIPQSTIIPTATQTPQPTSTPLPTATPQPTPTSTPVPTPSLTQTPTPTTIPINLTVKIALQGRSWTKGLLQRAVNVRVAGTSLDFQLITNESGELKSDLLNSLILGSYDLLIKPQGYLQKKYSIQLIAGTNKLDLTTIPLLAGDLDGSGKINSLDYNDLLVKFKSTDTLADLDGSGQVNSLDFSLILGNWNKQGDEEGN